MFFDRFEELCRLKGVKPGRACTEMGVSRSLASKWKSTGTEKPSADALEKMSKYFRMSIDEILGIALEGESLGSIFVPESLEGVAVAFNRGEFEGLTQSEVSKLAEYATFIKAQRAKEEG